MACRLEEIPAPGDFVEYQILDQSVIVVRVGASTVRAYYNSCRHGGMNLVEGHGSRRSFVCPFHGWCWSLDGASTFVLRAEVFNENNLGAEDLALVPVRCELWGGCAWINQDEGAPPLRDCLEPFAMFDRRAEQFADRVLMSIAGEPVTYAQMRDRSCAAANVLLDRGVARGDTVALFTATCAEWVYFWLGAARIGVVTAAVNAASKGDFLVHGLSLSRARLVLTDADRADRLAEVAGRIDTLDTTVTLGGPLSAELAGAPAEVARSTPAGPTDVGALFFTSGTTGPSEAVATTWHYLFGAAATAAAAWEFSASEVIWTAMPLFHLTAAPTVLAPMLVGGTSVVADAFHPTEVWDGIRDCGAIGFAGAGAMVEMLWNLPPHRRDADTGLRFISAAPISASRSADRGPVSVPRRDDVRTDRGVPAGLQGGFGGRRSGYLRTGQSGIRGVPRRPRRASRARGCRR